jgi:hypothetical protein
MNQCVQGRLAQSGVSGAKADLPNALHVQAGPLSPVITAILPAPRPLCIACRRTQQKWQPVRVDRTEELRPTVAIRRGIPPTATRHSRRRCCCRHHVIIPNGESTASSTREVRFGGASQSWHTDDQFAAAVAAAAGGAATVCTLVAATIQPPSRCVSRHVVCRPLAAAADASAEGKGIPAGLDERRHLRPKDSQQSAVAGT